MKGKKKLSMKRDLLQKLANSRDNVSKYFKYVRVNTYFYN